MKKQAAIIWTALSICGCTNVDYPPTPAATRLSTDTWSTGCQPDQKDPYGKLFEKRKCWAIVSYFGNSTEGVSIGTATLFIVDDLGPRIPKNPDLDTDLCDEKPVRIAVDGVRVDKLSQKEQIEKAINGSRLTREKDRGWPYCNVYNETTTLTGAKIAYQEMMKKWDEFKKL